MIPLISFLLGGVLGVSCLLLWGRNAETKDRRSFTSSVEAFHARLAKARTGTELMACSQSLKEVVKSSTDPSQAATMLQVASALHAKGRDILDWIDEDHETDENWN